MTPTLQNRSGSKGCPRMGAGSHGSVRGACLTGGDRNFGLNCGLIITDSMGCVGFAVFRVFERTTGGVPNLQDWHTHSPAPPPPDRVAPFVHQNLGQVCRRPHDRRWCVCHIVGNARLIDSGGEEQPWARRSGFQTADITRASLGDHTRIGTRIRRLRTNLNSRRGARYAKFAPPIRRSLDANTDGQCAEGGGALDWDGNNPVRFPVLR